MAQILTENCYHIDVMISAVVLTKNEEKNISPCLKSLLWCDRIIVVDDFSSDRTVPLAQKIGATVYKRRLAGDFAAQRNFGLEKAGDGWVLFVDADEVVPEKLAREIKHAGSHQENGFYLRREDFFMGRLLRFGETGNIKLLRLARRGCGQWERPVHEVWKISGSVGQLKTSLQHFSHPTIYQFVASINNFTDLDARHLPGEGKKFSYFRLLTNPLGKFLLNYFFKLGFLDGSPGFIMAFMMSLQSLVVRVKMYENIQG